MLFESAEQGDHVAYFEDLAAFVEDLAFSQDFCSLNSEKVELIQV